MEALLPSWYPMSPHIPSFLSRLVQQTGFPVKHSESLGLRRLLLPVPRPAKAAAGTEPEAQGEQT